MASVENLLSRRLLKSSQGRRSRPIVRLSIAGIAICLVVIILSISISTGYRNAIEQKVIDMGSHIRITYNEAKINESQATLARYKEQIDNVSNNREYDALSKEIEYQELEIQLFNKKIREAKHDIERYTEEYSASRQQLDERRGDLELKKSELDEIVSETRSEEEKLREKAKNLELGVDPRLLSAYKRIRKSSRNGLGIVYVERDACGGCFNKIPPQRQLDIKMRKKIIVCEYCGRIMIDPELAGVKIVAPGEVAPKKKRTIRRKKAEEAAPAPKAETPVVENPVNEER